jgi:phosphoglucosamine mutase
MKRLFGTDGIRGPAGEFPLDKATAFVVGRSLAVHLGQKLKGQQPRIIVGRDTRESGVWLETALIAGAVEGGAVCETAGVITTPGVAYLARTLPADAGIVISASHNPYEDNGIKIFAPSGRKLAEATEREIEQDIWEHKGKPVDVRAGTGNGLSSSGLREKYLAYLRDEIGRDLHPERLKMVVDCANGAASELAPALFASLGAEVVTINNTPDGRNINRDCGALHLGQLQAKVIEENAKIGIAFDGDADRAQFVDARGHIVDGDATLWVLAQYLDAHGGLETGTVVATVMSNIGLEKALNSRGWKLLRTDVGDKYVLEELLRTKAAIGGEQSGHIIFPWLSLAGDGMLTSLCLLKSMQQAGRELHELVEGFARYPQVLVNVRVREKRPFAEVPEVARAANAIESKLAGNGRLLLRYSGTEPLARVMIEGPNQDQVNDMANDLAGVIKDALG